VTHWTPLGQQQIRAYLHEVAGALGASGEQHVVVMVGGALLAWHGLRDATRDVDSVLQLDDELQQAVRTVAELHDLAPGWLNHAAAAFCPQTLTIQECDVFIDHPRLRVLGAPLRQVFLMKVRAGREQDHDDLVAMWPLVDLTPAQAVAEYWEAYPSAPEDEYLISWIEDIAAQTGPPR
jgi:hypothetical protein